MPDEPSSERWRAAAKAAMQLQSPEPKPSESDLATKPKSVQVKAKPRTPTRPFRPVGIPEPEPPRHKLTKPQASLPQPIAPTAPQTPTVAGPPPSKQGADTQNKEKDEGNKTIVQDPPAAVAKQPSPKPLAPANMPGPDNALPSPTSTSDVTLRQILQELRNQRSLGSSFSYLSILAIILQMVALVCLLAALVLGGEDGQFFRWLGAAVLMQLATIAALLFGR